jgi:thiamine-monophosphate kinase
VKLVIEGEALPLSAALKALWGKDAILRAATAGDDYQIAFTAPPGLAGPFTRIGHVMAGEGVEFRLNGAAVNIPHPGYRHF